MAAIDPDEQDPQTFHVDWAALHAGRNPWKRTARVAVDPFLVAKAVQGVMRLCPHQTATGTPLVWNEYSVFLELTDWERIKKLEATLVRDLGGVVEKALKKLKAEMVGTLNVRLMRDEGGSVRSGSAIIKVDFSEGDRLIPPDPSEMTVRVGMPVVRSITDLTERVEEVPAPTDSEEVLKLSWPGGTTNIRSGSRVVLGRPHRSPATGFVALTGAGSKINKRHAWIEAGDEGAVIGRMSKANPVEVKGRLIQAGGQIAIDDFPADISLSNGELKLTLERIEHT
ncbi:MAG TPA: FhaA domain-containing protein [Vicinamibacteria bacterium]|nr:FhaA domain-containing protein [Vicinamibacteria bacterium]